MNKCKLRITGQQFAKLIGHLFPGDGDEHGAVLLAGLVQRDRQLTLCIREVHLAIDGLDYVPGTHGYRALTPTFIHRTITRARDERLAYLAVHNHGTEDRVAFSRIDLDSHERGYPALLQIARGMPVGALVFGRNAIEADVWLPDGSRLSLDEATIVGQTLKRLMPLPKPREDGESAWHDRQVRMFGQLGQRQLSRARIAILGLGGVGSILSEYLARLGVGEICLVDPDRVEYSNLSRIVGASASDAKRRKAKVAVAKRAILHANPNVHVKTLAEDLAKESVARQLIEYDYLFLAADSMRARLVFNAIVNQYLIPGVQLGSKIRANSDGLLLDVMSANRPIRPGRGCLWCNQLIDPTELAIEAKSDAERQAQAYGVREPNPSVISLNAIAAAHAVNDFLLDYLALRPDQAIVHYEYFFPLTGKRSLVEPRIDPNCTECSPTGLRFARGDGTALPTIQG